MVSRPHSVKDAPAEAGRGEWPLPALAGAPRLLLVSDLQPCHVNGGPILMSRLLAGYPMDRLQVLAASYFLNSFPEGRLACEHISFPQPNNFGRWGLGRLKQLLQVASLPLLVFVCWREIRRRRIQVVAGVAHDLFFLAGALAARLSGVPFVLVVHDEWLFFIRPLMWLPNAVARWAYRRVLRSAAHIYAVCPEMRDVLRQEYGVESEVQLPAAEAQAAAEAVEAAGTLRIVFAGTLTGVAIPSLELLVRALKSAKLSGIAWSLDVYGANAEHLREFGWDGDARIQARGWAEQDELKAALRQADVLYLPYSFERATLRFVHTSFPSKLADYLAAGRAVLICAPPESSVVPYARERGFAEVVDRPSEELLAEALARLGSAEHRRRLAARGLHVFAENHDIARQQREFVACMARLAEQGKARETRVQVAGQ